MPTPLMTVQRIAARTGLSTARVRYALQQLQDAPYALVGRQPVYRQRTVQRVVEWNRKHGRKSK